MRDRFPGFYRPTEQFDAFFERGLICPDASVLLTLYKVSETTRDEVFAVFRELGDRLWLPHQVVLEFQRGRRTAIREQEEVYDELEAQLSSFPDRLTGKVRRHHPRIDREELKRVTDAAVADIKKHLDVLREAHPDPLASDDILGTDVVRDQLEEIVDGRIGGGLDPEEVERLGKLRYPKLVPPGYADAGKEGGREYGDLSIWLELLDEAAERKIPVLFITEDAKEDWWVKDGSETIGPRPELVQEMRDRAKCEFWMYRFEPFLSRAAEHFGIELGATVGAEVTEAQQVRVTSPSQWAQHSIPLASGMVTGYGDPQAEFVFSPSNPLVVNATRYPPSERNWHPPRSSEVELTDEGVRIRLQGSPDRLATELTCSVSDPHGVTTSTSLSAPPEATMIEVSYPFDARDGDKLQPGTYGYGWTESMGPGWLAIPISKGNFVVPV